MPLSIARIDHIVLTVQDMDRSISFYRDVLGCRIERTVDSIGLVQMRAGASMIDLCPAAPDRAGGDLDHFCLRIDPWDADAIRAVLTSAGIDAPKPVLRHGAEGEGQSIYIHDPDGHRLELKGPAIQTGS